jgi:hypothetical protein
MRQGIRFLAITALLAAVASYACADEIRLKDGTKIIGTIVGYEDNSFKVKTAYGFALVQKDQVVSIAVLEAEKNPAAEKKAEPVAEKPPEPVKATGTDAAATIPGPGTNSKRTKDGPNVATAASANKASSPAGSPMVETKPTMASASVNAAGATAGTANKAAVSTTSKTPTSDANAPGVQPNASVASGKSATLTPAQGAPTVAGSVAPPKQPEPEAPGEEVAGNTYTNRTWGFQMYKPPDWQVIPGARSMLPGAITAMGTSDQKTYLLIGQEVAGKSLASDMDAIEGRLRDVLENYRAVGEKRVTVSGLSAIQHKFRGSIDNHDWSGIVVFIPRDTHLYTIFGMTYADSDLVQIQENVISRAISSVQFTKQ